MKIYNKTLRKAQKYLKSGKYNKVIALLEPKVPLFIENYHFYYFLGSACYHSGDMGGAETYLKRAIQVNRKAEEPRLFLAAVYLKKKDTTEAVRIWLGLLDLNPSNRKAKKGLNRIRRISDQDLLIIFLDAGKFSSFLPRTKKIIPNGFTYTIILLILVFSLYCTSSLWLSALPKEEHNRRNDLSLLYKDIDKKNISETEESADTHFTLSEKEITETLKNAQSLFDQYRDNEARKEINLLKYSNASESVKQKAILLEGYLKDPDITSISGFYRYKDIMGKSYLYENCLVLWKGKISNLIFLDSGMQFDFLVGYEQSRILEGIVPVRIDFPVSLDPAYPLELLARVIVENDSVIRLQAISVHNIIE